MRYPDVFVNERTGVAHQRRDCQRGLIKYRELGNDVFRWLYRPHRPGVQPTMLTDWRECRKCWP